MIRSVKDEKVAAEISRLANKHGGTLTAKIVVDAARDPKSPLHEQFDWDDTVAAEKWREEQARYLIRHVQVIYENRGEPQRLMVSLPSERGTGTAYRRLIDVLSDEQLRKELLRGALSEMESFRRKYIALEELARVFTAMARTEKQLRASLDEAEEEEPEQKPAKTTNRQANR